MRDLNERLAEHGQMLALDPPGNPTIGACLAANLSGPRRHRYGTARDLVIGVTVVLADGTIASSGGKVVKNVAGYDLGKLFCGSEGRLGLIARVALRLHPRPEASRTLAVQVRSAAEAAAVARKLLHAPLELSALDVVWPGWVAVLIEGSRAAVDEQFEAAQTLAGGEEDFGSIWEEAEARQGWAQGRLLFAPGELAPTLAGARRGGRPRLRRRRLRRGAGARPARSRRARARRARARRARPGGTARVNPELLSDCVHCGFCLPTCPTYGVLWQEEMDSPRGRIYLMGSLVDGTIPLSDTTVRALRPLPRLYGVPYIVSLGREVRPADRGDARTRRGALQAVAVRARPARDDLRDRAVPEAAAAGAGDDAALAARAAEAVRRAEAAVALVGAAADGDAGRGRAASAGRAAARLRPARRLRRRQRRDRAGAGRRGLRGRRAGRPGVLRRAPPPRGAGGRGEAPRGAARRGLRRRGRDRRQRGRLRVTSEGGGARRPGRRRQRAARRARPAREAERAADQGRLPGRLPPRACAGDPRRAALAAAHDPRPRARRAGRAGDLLRERRDLQPGSARGGRGARAAEGGERRPGPARRRTSAPTRAASSRSRTTSASRVGGYPPCTRSSCSTRRSRASPPVACSQARAANGCPRAAP